MILVLTWLKTFDFSDGLTVVYMIIFIITRITSNHSRQRRLMRTTMMSPMKHKVAVKTRLTAASSLSHES